MASSEIVKLKQCRNAAESHNLQAPIISLKAVFNSRLLRVNCKENFTEKYMQELLYITTTEIQTQAPSGS